jgi:hypothetical protein
LISASHNQRLCDESRGFGRFLGAPESHYIGISGRPLAHPTARLQRITFRRYKKGCCIAEVNKETSNLGEPVGRVFAIIEFADLIQVYSTFRAWAHPILMKRHEVTERVYFEDYPAKPLQ